MPRTRVELKGTQHCKRAVFTSDIKACFAPVGAEWEGLNRPHPALDGGNTDVPTLKRFFLILTACVRAQNNFFQIAGN